MHVTKRDGSTQPLDIAKIQRLSAFACEGLDVSQSELEVKISTQFFDGIKTSDIHDAQIISAASLISRAQPDYTYVAARLLLMKVYKEVTGGAVEYPHLRDYIAKGIREGRLNSTLAFFDLDALNGAIVPGRDYQFDYLGLQTVADRYLIRAAQKPGQKKAPIIEMPQHFLMRVAMGLALRDPLHRTPDTPFNCSSVTEQAIEFYNVLSKFDFLSSTPTLFNSGTPHSQMSSCYLNTVSDTLVAEHGQNEYASIFGTITECAIFSKWAGGIGTDWTRVRGAGDVIKGTNGKSAGVVPYLKIFNDTAVAVNQGGKRNGAFAAYLEPWHPDFMDFCDIKKNSGDERRRAHDIFPAGWMPDLFFKRVEEGGMWSFFSPNLYPELHELYGDAFEARYVELEQKGAYVNQLPAAEVWRKVITSLWETGHPWVTFKDESNRRNPQSHVGVVHNSNLCTEITLNTSDEESAVCNLGSINLSRHVAHGMIDYEKLRETTRTAVRMLDNVVDLNFYPSERARTSNLKHRPIGLGVMGLSDMLAKLKIDWESAENVELQDALFERISYYAIEASCDLALERGAYETFEGSKWSLGILPINTARDDTQRLDWARLRSKVMRNGMRNSNVMAIAPTATIANIAGVTPSIEPPYELEYTKENLSGDFTVIAPSALHGFLVKHAFEVAAKWVIATAAKRQKWIDQSQSVNIFVGNDMRGRDLSDIYLDAWRSGLKTTYYLRRKVVDVDEVAAKAEKPVQEEAKFCSISDPDCESCQ